MDNIVLLFGGNSCERDISIITACQCFENIDKSKYKIYPIYMYDNKMYLSSDMKVKHYIDYKAIKYNEVYFQDGYMHFRHRIVRNKRIKIDNSIICNHGGEGENGALQGMLDIAKIPYTSPSTMPMSILMDKVGTKHILKSLDVPHVKYRVLHTGDNIDYVNIAKYLGYPIIVKPAHLGSSIGISKISNKDSLKDAIELAFFYDDKVILESCIEDFREYNIALFRHNGKIILSDIESPKVDDILDFNDKYMTSGKMNGGYREFPAAVSDVVKTKIEEFAQRVYMALDMKGVVRVDYIVKGDKVYLNEVNTVPGSLAYYLFEKKGISYTKLIDMMLEESEKEFEKSQNLIHYYKSSVLKSVKSSNNKLRK